MNADQSSMYLSYMYMYKEWYYPIQHSCDMALVKRSTANRTHIAFNVRLTVGDTVQHWNTDRK